MLADVIFHGGTILTVDDDFSQVEAVAVVGDKIAAVGTLADLEGLRGPDTRDIDLLGATMLPGFVEAHGHPTLEMSMIGPGSIDVRATVCGTTEEVMRRLRERIDNAKPGEWIAAFGWDPLMLTDLPPISGVWLDELSPNNPISIMHNSAHGTWVNKLALEQLGITKDTPNPTASEYVRDENGELTGEAREIPACFNFMGPAMAVTDETFGDFMSNEMHRFNSAGVTTSGDLGFPKEGMFDWVRKYADAGKSTLRIRAYEMSDASLASPRSPGVGDAMFRQIGIKCWADGSPWIGNIQTSFPYQDSSYTRAIGVEPGHKGGANYTREAFTELVRAYFSKGWQLACHTHGDVVIDMVLDVYEQVMAEFPREDARLRLEHCGAMTSKQYERAVKLGVYTSIFIAHVYYWGDILVEFFGQPGEEWMALKRAADAGMKYSFHNDAPVSPSLPLLNMGTAVVRQDRNGKPHAPELGVSIEDAIRAQTCWAALHLFSEDEVGSIEVGKFADFVVLEADPRQVDPATLKDVKILGTYLGGKLVYGDE